ncbi:MAG: response regulator transcription factor [Alphaproteobacteria bacterium]
MENLTKRQSEVVRLIAQGLPNKEIAYRLGVSESTIKLHVNAILKTFHVHNRTQALLFAQQNHFI